jgi:hypothetical protein
LASLSAFQFPQAISVSPFWCPWQCINATCLGAHTMSSSSRISCPYLILFQVSSIRGHSLTPKLESPLFIKGSMDMNGCEGIFTVSINVYSYCSDLECLQEGNKFSLLYRSPNWQ